MRESTLNKHQLLRIYKLLLLKTGSPIMVTLIKNLEAQLSLENKNV